MPKKETYNKTQNISLHPELVNWLCDHYQTDNASEAIRKGIHEFLTKSSYSKRMDDFALHQIILTVEERTTIKKYSIRITDDMDKAIKAYATNDTGFNTVTVMLANYLYFSSAAQAPSTPAKASSLPAPGKFEPDYSMKLLPLAGSKWSPVMQDAIKKIFDSSGKRWQTSIDAFVGALGIFSNFKVADHEVINDIDLRKVNLYRAIRDYMYILLEKMLSKPVDEDTFEQCKSLLNNGAHLSDAEVNLDAAACFLFTTLLSARNTGHTFSGKALSTYRKNMDAIALLNERMKDTEIYGRYALELIEKYMKSEDSIFIIDPPYIDTNIYKSSIIIDEKYDAEKEEFGYKEHMRLAKLLRKTHQEYGNDFIYFCRITAPHKFDSKPDKDKQDRHMEGRIDDLYWGYGHYYIDVPLLKDNSITAIERIITSFDFSGAQPYGNGRGQN